jgi:hypothetical protein
MNTMETSKTTVYRYNTRKLLVGSVDTYVDITATIEGPEGAEFIVECLSESEYAIRFFEFPEDAAKFGKSFNRKADRKDQMSHYTIYPLYSK